MLVVMGYCFDVVASRLLRVKRCCAVDFLVKVDEGCGEMKSVYVECSLV